MKELLEALIKLVPFLQSYPLWVRGLVGAWILLTATILIVVIVVPKQSKGTDLTQAGARATWPTIGDDRIDRVHAALNQIESQPANPSEAELIAALKPLFDRPLFRHIQEERFESALFTLCRTQLLLEHYVSVFRSSPDIRDKIGYATTRIIKLEQLIAPLYGPAFSAERHCESYGRARTLFLSKLPPQIGTPDASFYSTAGETLSQLRKALKPIGLVDYE